MFFNAKQQKTLQMDYFYFELKDGKARVTESPTNDHSWLWKHDYKNCQNNHIPKEEHMERWRDSTQRCNLHTSNGFSIPNFDRLKIELLGLYKSPDFIVLSTICRKRYAFFLIDGILPDEILDMISDDEVFQKHLIDHHTNVYYDPSSELKSFSAYGHLPMLIHEDSEYRYLVFRLDALRNGEPLFYIEVTCHSHNNRRHYAFGHENIARSFIKDFSRWPFQFCSH